MAEEASLTARLKDEISASARKGSEALKELAEYVEHVNQRVERASRGWMGFVAGFASVETFRKAVEEFRELEQVTTRLKSSLGADAGQFDLLQEKAEAAAKSTTFSVRQLMSLQATLLSRGVGIGQLDTAVKAAVNTSAALGMSLEAAGDEIAMTYGGIAPRSIRMAVKELKDFTPEQLKAGAAADVLAKKYAGFAEARARTASGKLEQSEKQMEETYEELGRTFTKLEADVVPALTKSLKELVEYFDTKSGRDFVDRLGKMGAELAGNAGKIVAVIAALKAAGMLQQALGSGKNAGTGLLGLFVQRKVGGEAVEEAVAEGKAVGAAASKAEAAAAAGTGGVALTAFGKMALLGTAIAGVSFLVETMTGKFTGLDTTYKATDGVIDRMKKLKAAVSDVLTGDAPGSGGGTLNNLAQSLKIQLSHLAAMTGLSSASDEEQQEILQASQDSALQGAPPDGDKRRQDQRAKNLEGREQLPDTFKREAELKEKLDQEYSGKYDEAVLERNKKELARNEDMYKQDLVSLQAYLATKTRLEQAQNVASIDAALKKYEEATAERTQLEAGLPEMAHEVSARSAVASRHQAAGTLTPDDTDKMNAAFAAYNTRVLEINKAISAQIEYQNQLNLAKQAYLDVQLKLRGEAAATATSKASKEGGDFTKSMKTIGDNSSPFMMDQAQTQRTAAMQEYAEAIAEATDEMKKLIATSSTPDEAAKYKQRLLDIQAEAGQTLAATEGTVQNTVNKIETGIGDPLSKFFQSAMTDSKHLTQAVTTMINGIASNMAQMASQAASKALMGAVFGSFTGEGGSSQGGLLSGLINGISGLFGGGGDTSFTSSGGDFAEGGMIGGTRGRWDADDVPMWLTPGEFVVRRSASDYYGSSAMHAVNRMMVPRSVLAAYGASGSAPQFKAATGGPVMEHSAGPQHVIVHAVVPPTEEHAEALINSPYGMNSLARVMSNNQSTFKNALGVS